MTFEEALKVYQNKGPVCMCSPGEGCYGPSDEPNRCGPQKQVLRAVRVIEARIPDGIPITVHSGRLRVLSAVGEHKRWEFDDPMAEWLKTLQL